MKHLNKSVVRDGRYYSGYKHQNYTAISNENAIVAQWNSKTQTFWYMANTGIGKINKKEEILHMDDIDLSNEISVGFCPLKEVIPKEEYLIE